MESSVENAFSLEMGSIGAHDLGRRLGLSPFLNESPNVGLSARCQFGAVKLRKFENPLSLKINL